jgi:hypothetical protein
MAELAAAPRQPAAAGADGVAPPPGLAAGAAGDLDGRERSPRRAAREQQAFEQGRFQGAALLVIAVSKEVQEMTRGTENTLQTRLDEVNPNVIRCLAVNKALTQVMTAAWRALDDLKP